MKTYITAALGFILSGAMKGGSLVLRDGDLAIKVFRPKPLVRFVYLIFYGRTRSYYETLDGVYKAFFVRNVANHVTTLMPEIGRPVFAQPRAIKFHEGSPALVMEWIDGETITKAEAREFQLLLEQVLLESGLPTWSINVQNPGAYKDMRRKSDGNIIVLDYESALPPLFVNREERTRMGKSGLWLPIDWVDLECLEQTLEQARIAKYPDFEAFNRQVGALKFLYHGGSLE